ncbi:hypothetical protein RFI_33664, partial [Reticulomyxa filosa]
MSANNSTIQPRELPYVVSAFKDAITIDAPIYTGIALKPLINEVEITPTKGLFGFVGANTAYTLRKNINYYFQNYFEDGLIPAKIKLAAFAGGIGSAIKYGITKIPDLILAYNAVKSPNQPTFKTLLLMKTALGAFNNFGYEAFGPSKCPSKDEDGKVLSKYEQDICAYRKILAIETGEGL